MDIIVHQNQETACLHMPISAKNPKIKCHKKDPNELGIIIAYYYSRPQGYNKKQKENKMKKTIAMILALVLAFSMVACTASGNANTESKAEEKQPETVVEKEAEAQPEAAEQTKELKERVVIANSATLHKLDPQTNNTAVNRTIYEMSHNTLVGVDYSTGEHVPELALSWEQPDTMTYIFHLRDDVDFQNGEHFTADDVIFTYERGLEAPSQYDKLKTIESMEAIDEYTVKITVNAINSEFLDNLAITNLAILNREAVEADAEKGPAVGTGAYIIDEWVPDDYVSLVRNENFWGELPPTKEFVYKKISEASARVIALQTGEVDVCLSVPGIEAPHIVDSNTCSLIQLPSTKLVYLAMNMNGNCEALNDERVRLALNYATNSDDIILATKEGYAEVPNGVIPQGVVGYSDSVQAYSYDLEKAKELLAEAGYADGLDITFAYDEAKYPGLYEILQADWALAGINLILAADDDAVYSDMIDDESFEVLAAEYGFATIGTTLQSLWTSSSPSCRTLIRDAELDAMIDDAICEPDEAARLAKYATISQYLTDTACMIPAYIDMHLIGIGNNVTGGEWYSNGRNTYTYIAVAK